MNASLKKVIMLSTLKRGGTEMKNRKLVVTLVLALLVISAMSIAGCSNNQAASTSSGQPAKKGTIVVAGKNFGEGYVLGQIAAILLQQKSDLNVDTSKIGMGPTELLFPALQKDQIDVYADYTGTIWTTVLKNPVIHDRQQLISQTTAQLKSQDNVVALQPLGFNDTFCLAMRPDQAKQLGITKISDLKNHPELKLIGDSTTFTRPDVYIGMAKYYGITLTRGPIVDTNFFYDALQQKQGDVATLFTTDGKLKQYGFTVLQDDKGYYPWYDAEYLVNGATLQKYPEIATVLNELAGKINEQTMINLNYQVDVQKQDPATVAKQWLQSQGLI
jgi:glycine betaine/choline ABC-type transport system substrate-binding protein